GPPRPPQRRDRLAVADRVQAAALPDAQRRAGDVEGTDRRAHLAVRLRRRPQHRRDPHVLLAAQARRAAGDRDGPRGRLRPARGRELTVRFTRRRLSTRWRMTLWVMAIVSIVAFV